jgi:branched-chain amino acid transport system ATP-binding protein
MPSKGNVVFEGKNISGFIPSRINRLGISRVFQATVLFSEATVRENVTRGLVARAGFNGVKDLLRLEGKKHQWADAQAKTILKLCGLDRLPRSSEPSLDSRDFGLLALASRPKVLLDEPVAGMSTEERTIIAGYPDQAGND